MKVGHPLHVCVMGMGNVFLGDDGFGPMVVEKFRCEYECDLNVDVVDVGTPGLDLAPYLHGKDLIVLVDAVQADGAPGTLTVYSEQDFVSSGARAVELRITGHDPGVWESLAHMRLAGCAPADFIIIGVVPQSCCFGASLSPAMMSAVPTATEVTARLLSDRGVNCRRRFTRLQPNLWWLPIQQDWLFEKGMTLPASKETG